MTNEFTIFVRDLNGNDYSIDVKNSTSISEIIDEYKKKRGFNEDKSVTLAFKGKKLKSNETIKDKKIEELNTLRVVDLEDFLQIGGFSLNNFFVLNI